MRNFLIASQSNRISVVRSILNALPTIDTKEELIVELVKAFNGMIPFKERNRFSNKVTKALLSPIKLIHFV